MSYGKHWDELNNKRTLLVSQSFKNQSTHNHTGYTLEVKPTCRDLFLQVEVTEIKQHIEPFCLSLLLNMIILWSLHIIELTLDSVMLLAMHH